MLRIKIGLPSRTWQYRTIKFLCPNCQGILLYMISDDPTEISVMTKPPDLCTKCWAVMPEVDKVMESRQHRLIWHRSEDIYFLGE